MKSRFRLAWAALRGHAIIHGVDIRYGEIDATRHKHLTLGHTTIEQDHILTSGPVIFRGDTRHVHGNEGTALAAKEAGGG